MLVMNPLVLASQTVCYSVFQIRGELASCTARKRSRRAVRVVFYRVARERGTMWKRDYCTRQPQLVGLPRFLLL